VLAMDWWSMMRAAAVAASQTLLIEALDVNA